MSPGPIDSSTRAATWVFYFARFFIRQFYNLPEIDEVLRGD